MKHKDIISIILDQTPQPNQWVPAKMFHEFVKEYSKDISQLNSELDKLKNKLKNEGKD